MPLTPKACATAAVALLLLAAAVSAHAGGGACVHDKMKQRFRVTPVEQTYHQASSARDFEALSTQDSAYKNMRTRYYLDLGGKATCKKVGDMVNNQQGSMVRCKEADIATTAKVAYWHRLMRDAALWFSNALRVVPLSGPLVPPSMCGDLPTNGSIPNTDFIIYVVAVPDASADTLAWAASCGADTKTGRSVASIVNIVPSMYGPTTAHKYTLDRATFIHEIAHALGFSDPFFHDGHMDLAWARKPGGVLTQFDAKLGKTVTKLTSPRVLKWARDYFGCPTLDGVEIEDQGGSGTGGSHWEKRILAEEFMVGVETLPVAYISGLTLAFFEDLGNFRANYSWVEDKNMMWGRNTKCDVTGNKCNADLAGAKSMFCVRNPSVQQVCTVGRIGIGSCDAGEYFGSIPKQFQYFSGKPAMSGGTETLDFCPIIEASSRSVCIDPANANNTNLGNTFAPSSRCFTSTLTKTGSTVIPDGNSRCHLFSCAPNGRLTITVNTVAVLCPADGSSTTVSVSGFLGKLTCPPSWELCGPMAQQGTTAKPTTAKPMTTKPRTTKPMTTKPMTTKPMTTKPMTTKPMTTKPMTTKPMTTKPMTTKPMTTKPMTTKPMTTKPMTTKPMTLKPATLKPTTLKPTTLKPMIAKPTTRKPMTTARPATPEPPAESDASEGSSFGSSDE